MPKLTRALPCTPIPDKKSGIYKTTWTADHPVTGKPFTDFFSFGTRDLNIANAAYVDWLVLHAKGATAKADGRRTVHWCLDYYLTNHVDQGKIVNTACTKRVLAMWKKYFGPEKMVDEINKVDPDDLGKELDLTRWARLRRLDRGWNNGKSVRKDGTPKVNKPLKESTLQHERKILKIAINYCIDTGVLSNLNQPKIEIGKQQKGRIGTIDEDQFMVLQALLEKANSPKMHGREDMLPGIFIWAWIMFMTGARTNEAQLLKWDKVDLDKGRVIDFSLDDRPDTCKVRNPEAPIPDALLPILRRAKEEAVSEWVCIKPVTFGSTFTDYCAAAGFPTTGNKKITAHSMRHSRITLAVASGMESGEASDLFRLDITTMIETYYHGTAAKRAKNANGSMDQKKLLRASIKTAK